MAPFDFSAFPILTTRRLVLRELTPADAADVFLFCSDLEEQKYNSEPMRQVSQAQTLIEEVRGAYAAHHALYWGLTLPEDDRVIGLFGFNYWDRQHRRAMIGFDLARAHWGQGIAKEGAKAVMQFGFEQMQLNRIEAATVTRNTSALRLLEKLGFQREGTSRQHSRYGDCFYDLALYGILRGEYASE